MYCETGDYYKAIVDYDKAIELDPKNAITYRSRGYAYYRIGIYDKAIADYDKAIELDPEDAATYHNRGDIYREKGEYDKAIADYSKVIELDPENATVYIDRGNAYAEKGEYDKTIADYSKAIQLNPNHAVFYRNLNPNHAAFYLNRGILYDDEVIRKLNETISSTVNFLGRSCDVRDVREFPLTILDLDEAIQDLDKLIRENPDDPPHYINRGNTYFYICNYERAISDYSKFIQIYPDSAKAYLDRGDAHFCKGEYDKAISDYSKAIKIDPVYAEVYDARSNAYKRIGESNQAREDEDKALGLGFDPQSYVEDSNLELIENLVQSCPKNAKVYYYRGLVRGCNGDYNLAIEDYNKALQLNPQFAPAYHKRAEIYNYHIINRDPECHD